MSELRPRISLHGLPFHAPWVSRRGTVAERWSLVVEIGDGSLVGFGEAPLPLRVEDPGGIARAAARSLPRLPGDAAAADAVLGAVPAWLRHGVMSAMVDLEAKREGLTFAQCLLEIFPVERIRAPAAQDVWVNANLGPLAPDEAAREATRLVAAGFRTIKLKSLGVVEEDTLRLAAIRDAVDDGVRLRLDANGAWRPRAAEAALRELARFDLEYVEQPVSAPDRLTARRLAAASAVPLAWDESVTDAASAAALAASGAEVLVVKPPRTGGPDRVLAILEAAGNSVDCVVSTPLEGAIGRAVDLQLALLAGDWRAHGLATDGVLAHDYGEPAPMVSRGMLHATDGPGLGAVRLAAGHGVAWGDQA